MPLGSPLCPSKSLPNKDIPHKLQAILRDRALSWGGSSGLAGNHVDCIEMASGLTRRQGPRKPCIIVAVEILTYDPAANAARLRRHPLLAVRRAFEILWTFGWFWVVYWFSKQNWLPFRRTKQEREIYCGRYLARCLVDLGPTFIKLGQALSTRPDVLPKPYVQELTRLQDRVPAYDTRIAIATIERELGKPVSELFPTFDFEPMSAASIGQVYKARTPEGDRVIVKVQRPNLPSLLTNDLDVKRLFAR